MNVEMRCFHKDTNRFVDNSKVRLALRPQIRVLLRVDLCTVEHELEVPIRQLWLEVGRLERVEVEGSPELIRHTRAAIAGGDAELFGEVYCEEPVLKKRKRFLTQNVLQMSTTHS